MKCQRQKSAISHMLYFIEKIAIYNHYSTKIRTSLEAFLMKTILVPVLPIFISYERLFVDIKTYNNISMNI